MNLDKIPMGKANDGRRKITDDQKLQMHKLYRDGMSIHQISRDIGCSKRSVQFQLFPERLKRVQQLAKDAKRWEPYNTKELRREVMRKYRGKKRHLLLAGMLKVDVSNS